MRKILTAILIVAAAALLAVAVLRITSKPSAPAAPVPLPTDAAETAAPATPPPTPTEAPTPTAAPTPTPTPPPTPEPTPERPDLDIGAWNLVLVNPTHSIGDYVPELTELEGGQYFDTRAVDALKAFIAAGREAGHSVVINSSYRGYATQEYLFNRKVAQYGGDRATAATIVAPPGTSEHQTGLCVDVADQFYSVKDRSIENTATYKWLYAHCAEYGFILRYPDGKQDVTGIMYEPWHFRYVGEEAAQFIMERGLTLEEFWDLYADAAPAA